MALPILAALLGGAIQAGAAAKASKQQTSALRDSTAQTVKYANLGKVVQQDAARNAGRVQVVGANNAADALISGARAGGADQVAGYDNANALLRDFGNSAQDTYNPYVQAGQTSINALMAHLNGDSGYQQSAGYQFRKKQGEDAIAAAAAKYGNLFSGATGQALVDYNQNLAAADEQQYVNNLLQATSAGQSGTNALMSLLQANSGALANNAVGRGNALANIDFNVGNADAARASGVADARANAFLNVGNAAANAASTIGGVAGANAANIGASKSAGTIGFGNALNDAIGQGVGVWQYNQMLKQMPNYAG